MQQPTPTGRVFNLGGLTVVEVDVSPCFRASDLAKGKKISCKCSACNARNEAEKARKAALTVIYRHTHRDYKQTLADGTKSVLMLRGIVALDEFTAADIADRLPHAMSKEAARLAAKQT